MLQEKSNNQIDIQESSLPEQDKIEKKEKKIIPEGKKNISKRFPMEKTVDDTIKKINILLQKEVI